MKQFISFTIKKMTERKLLNERFKNVFYQLEEKGDFVKHCRKKGMTSFAEKILNNKANGHLIREYLNDNKNRTITYAQAKRLIEHFNVREDFLFRGEGPVFESTAVSDTLWVQESSNLANQSEPKAVSTANNITFSSVAAFASGTFAVNPEEKTEQFYIPEMYGKYIAFYIQGNSMTPTIDDGDMIICKALEIGEIINENKIYAIVLNSGTVLIKRIQQIPAVGFAERKLKLISDNYLEHDPFEVPTSEIRKILRVERKLTEVGF